MLLLIDDVCPDTIPNLKYLDEIKIALPELQVILFTVANFKNKGLITECKEFLDYVCGNTWVSVGVHGYDHSTPPEQERDDAEALVRESLEILAPVLPKRFLYRPPGFQRTVRTESMLERLGFGGIAYQTRIKYFTDPPRYFTDFINAHLTEDRYYNPINRWKEWGDLQRFR